MKSFHKWRPDTEDLFGLQLHGCNVLFRKLQRNIFWLSVFRVSAEHFREQICIYAYLSQMRNASQSGFSKFQQKSFNYSWEKPERLCLFVVVVSWMTESRTFERKSVFPEHPIDFDDFPEQIWYSCNGRHVWYRYLSESLYQHYQVPTMWIRNRYKWLVVIVQVSVSTTVSTLPCANQVSSRQVQIGLALIGQVSVSLTVSALPHAHQVNQHQV